MSNFVSAINLRIIREEEEKLLALKAHYIKKNKPNIQSEIAEQIIELRSSLQGANTDDIPHITEQIHNLMNVASHSQEFIENDLSLEIPYFTHMQLEESDRIFDFYLGSSVLYIPDSKMQIIDWRTSPISRIYYLYQPGEEYSEYISDRLREGMLLYKRYLNFKDGQLVRIQEGNIVLENRNNQWIERKKQHSYLQGGSGIALRRENTKTMLGIGESNSNPNKALSAITGLLDEEQFKLITQPTEGILAIQGAAGSGKTTVALHRIGWLYSQNPKRFKKNTILVIVFNKALARYISQVLPALGVSNAQVNYFENWLFQLFHNLLHPSFPKAVFSTKISIIRFKKHPFWLTFIAQFFQKKEAILYNGLKDITKETPSLSFLTEKKLPFIATIKNLYKQLHDTRSKALFPEAIRQRILELITNLIKPTLSERQIIKELFLELLDDFSALEEAFRTQAHELKKIDIEQGIARITQQYILLQEEKVSEEAAALDIEDIPLILYVYYLFCGKIMPNTEKLPLYQHIVLDEAQDFSPLEVKILTLCSKKPLSLTLAGDMNQTIQQHNFFSTWSTLFHQIQESGKTISSLQVSYRSTQQIMRFAYSILPKERQDAKNIQFESSRQGPPVSFFSFQTQGEQVLFLSEQLSQLMYKEPNASVAVICATEQIAKTYYEYLRHATVPSLRYIEDQEFPFVAGIDVTDVMQVKGLEFDYVILPDISARSYGNNVYAQFLLHVAATRASHQLWLMTHETPSPLLPEYITNSEETL